MGKSSAALRRYEVWVKQQPSAVTGRPSDDNHHIKVKGLFGGSLKPKLSMIPLTRDEHAEFHAIGQKSFESKYNISQTNEALNTIEKALKQKILSFDHKYPDSTVQAIEALFRSEIIVFNAARSGEVLQASEMLYLAEVIKAV